MATLNESICTCRINLSAEELQILRISSTVIMASRTVVTLGSAPQFGLSKLLICPRLANVNHMHMCIVLLRDRVHLDVGVGNG